MKLFKKKQKAKDLLAEERLDAYRNLRTEEIGTEEYERALETVERLEKLTDKKSISRDYVIPFLGVALPFIGSVSMYAITYKSERDGYILAPKRIAIAERTAKH